MIRRTAVREAGASRHHGKEIEGPMKPLEQHSNIALRGLRDEASIGSLLCGALHEMKLIPVVNVATRQQNTQFPEKKILQHKRLV